MPKGKSVGAEEAKGTAAKGKEHPALSKLAGLLSSITLPLKAAREVREAGGAKEGFGAGAPEALRKTLQALTKNDETRWGLVNRWLREEAIEEWGRSQEMREALEGLERELGAGAKQLGEARGEALEAAAQALSKHFAFAFARGKDQYLAYPSQGGGVKLAKAASEPGAEKSLSLSAWRSGLGKTIYGIRNRHDVEMEGGSLEELERLGAKERLEEMGLDGLDSGREFDGGVDLLRTPQARSSQEESLGLLALQSDPERASDSAWRALSAALGDEADPIFGPKGEAPLTPSVSALDGLRMMLSVKKIRMWGATAKDWKAAAEGIRYEKAPFIALAQGARLGRDARESAKELPESLRGWVGAAEEFLGAAEEAALRLERRALELAREREAVWLEGCGLKEGVDLARRMSANGEVSTKSLSWTTANLAAARSLANADPREGLALACSRFFGCIPREGESLYAALRPSLEEKGLGLAGEGLLLGDKEARDELARLAQQGSKAGLRGDAQRRIEGFCRSFEAAGKAGKGAQEALALFRGLQAGYAFEGSDSSEGFLPQVRERMVESKEEAEELIREARAKRGHLGWIYERALEREGELRGEGEEDRFEEEVRAMVGDWRDCRIRWSEMGPECSWEDLRKVRPERLAKAAKEARETGGAAGRIADAALEGSTIADAESGNDLIAKTRGFLISQFGFTEGTWKDLLRGSPERLGGFCERLEKLGEEMREEGYPQKRPKGEEAYRGNYGMPENYEWLKGAGEALAAGMVSRPGEWELAEFLRQRPMHSDDELHFSPRIPGQRHDGEEGGAFCLAESEAKRKRYPQLLKAACDRIGQLEREIAKESPQMEEVERRSEAAKSFWEKDWGLLSDWLGKSEAGLWQNLPEKFGWSAVWRWQKEWHEEMAAAAADRAAENARAGRSAKGWAAPLGKLEEGAWSAVELNSAIALTEEGAEMRHCVSSYAPNCRRGESRILSIRCNGERVATLQLKARSEEKGHVKFSEAKAGDEWEIVQNRGKCNAEVKGKDALAFCQKVAKAYKEAFGKSLEERAKREAAARRERVAKELVLLGDAPGGGVEEGPRRGARI